ncbi:MAG TPA: phosphate ABC transporter permease PstA [Marmoricola sp.]|nr:phosphate ABC transporter permease PstA [Marmoricola sp.]
MAQLLSERLPATPLAPLSLRRPRLPRWAPTLTGVVAAATALLLAVLLGWGAVTTVVVAAVLHLVLLPAWSRAVEGARAARDRLATALVWGALALALVPLASMLWKVVTIGAPHVDARFLTWSMRNVVGEPGGIYHAIIGTLLITLTATVISVPVGLLSAIYLVEYGGSSRLATSIRFLVDVMTGIPSIVAGLFAYALFSIVLGPGTQLALGGGVALSLLMVPIVVRSAEEMLRLVPDELREAAYALGVPQWRAIVKVVLPTALGGIITGVTLAVARVIGETAPLLIICGSTDSTNFDIFGGQMASLPVFIYSSYTQPGVDPGILQGMAWGAAFVLIVIVMALNLLARLAGRLLAPRRPR